MNFFNENNSTKSNNNIKVFEIKMAISKINEVLQKIFFLIQDILFKLSNEKNINYI